MNIRERTENHEKEYLSPYAALSVNTKGREKDAPLCDLRTEFQRDRDRIIHSKAFRRLKHKTQVFITPEGDHYRTRLTHTLEVSQIARTIANALKLNEDLTEAIALGHDLGHTPFGHSGEETISSYFTDGPGQKLKDMMPEYQWSDLASFEGNANAFRQLTHQFAGRRQGGMSLTYATLATLVKYPYLSYNKGGKKKYNVFYSEKETFKKVMDGCGIPCLDENNFVYARHPLSYMMEAADDICYLILDMEDAHKRGIVATQKIDRFFTSFFKKEETWFFERKESIYETVTDDNERMAFLRATVINKLVECVAKVFIDNYDDIMNGNFEKALVSHLPDHEKNAMEKCREFSLKNIYKHPTVVKVELTGFNVIGSLVDEFVNAALEPQKIYNKKLLSLIPEQFKNNEDDLYSRVQVVLDYISNMTDLYAVQLYKDLRGIR